MRAEDWDREAATFDSEPDHGLLDVDVRRAWSRMIRSYLPAPPARILDVGCGTGSLSVLLADEGHLVTGLDLSPMMLARARAKASAAGAELALVQGDASRLPFRQTVFDAVLCRHVLWVMADMEPALDAWARLLDPRGVLLLVEGQWSTGAGLSSTDVVDALGRLDRDATVQPLTDEQLWGPAVDDDRYLVSSRARQRRGGRSTTRA